MTINEFEKLVNENKLCCYGVREKQSFSLWKEQDFFRRLREAEENLRRCGYSLNVNWLEDDHHIEYAFYKEAITEKQFVTLMSGDVFSWYEVRCMAKMACSALGIEYNWKDL